MTWRRATVIFIWVAIGIIVAYDVAALVRGGYPATISATTIRFVYAHPPAGVFLGLAIGVLLGHLFWSQPEPKRG